MPIPTPHNGEAQKDFVARCMGDEVMVHDYDDQKQRAAVCYSAWEHKKTSVNIMRLYGAIEKVEPLDDGTVRVHGIATTEAVDDQGEIVRASAMRAAIPDYMKFPAVREMHQLSAAGTTLAADVGDDNVTRIVAHVVDPGAVAKVKNRVYRGFSIGGRVTQRESGNPKCITGLNLNEISLVDRPANPESVYEFWKASEVEPPATAAPFNPPIQIWSCGLDDHRHLAKSDAMRCQEAQKASVNDPPVSTMENLTPEPATQNIPVVEEVTKADDPKKPYGDVTYADTGFQDDKKKRYPIDTEAHIRAAWNYINKPNNAGQYSSANLATIKARIVAAWKAKIDKDGPPSASDKAAMAESFRKALWNIPQLIYLCNGLQDYCDSLFVERAVEGDDSDQPEKLQSIVSSLMGFLRDQVAEDTAEALQGTDADEDDMLAECWAPHASVMMKILSNIQGSEELVNEIEKRGMRHNRADQALLDTTAYAMGKAMASGTAKRGDLVRMADARKAVLDAGASDLNASPEMLTNSNPTGGAPTQNSTVDTGRSGNEPVPQPGIGGGANITMVKTAGFAAIDAIEKAGGGHVALMNAAHDLLCSVSDGIACKEGDAPSRHSAADTAMMVKAHDHMIAVGGVKCAANEIPGGEPTPEGEAEGQGTTNSAAKAAQTAADEVLAKTFESVLAKYAAPQPDPLIKTLADSMAALTTKMETIAADVVKIKETPLPPATMARLPVAKSGDGSMITAEMTPDQIAQALAKMSKEEQTITYIRAAQAAPIRIPGITDGPAPPGSPTRG